MFCCLGLFPFFPFPLPPSYGFILKKRRMKEGETGRWWGPPLSGKNVPGFFLSEHAGDPFSPLIL